MAERRQRVRRSRSMAETMGLILMGFELVVVFLCALCALEGRDKRVVYVA